jgi:hypothetical protein
LYSTQVSPPPIIVVILAVVTVILVPLTIVPLKFSLVEPVKSMTVALPVLLTARCNLFSLVCLPLALVYPTDLWR